MLCGKLVLVRRVLSGGTTPCAPTVVARPRPTGGVVRGETAQYRTLPLGAVIGYIWLVIVFQIGIPARHDALRHVGT